MNITFVTAVDKLEKSLYTVCNNVLYIILQYVSSFFDCSSFPVVLLSVYHKGIFHVKTLYLLFIKC
jgi:hypothetical protein